MRRSHKLGALLTALIITSPVVSTSMTSFAQVLSPLPSEIRQRALNDRSSRLADRREYKKIVEDCERKAKAGIDVRCPEINDVASIRAFLRGDFTLVNSSASSVSSSSSVASSSSSVSSVRKVPALTISDIADGDLSLLRRYRQNENCPEALKTGKQAGFYEFCLEFIKEGRRDTEKSRQLMRKVRQRIQSIQKVFGGTTSSEATLNDRLESLPEGIRPDR